MVNFFYNFIVHVVFHSTFTKELSKIHLILERDPQIILRLINLINTHSIEMFFCNVVFNRPVD